MEYLIILATASLSTAKVSFQSLLAKREKTTPADRVFFTMLIFFAAALMFSPYLFTASLSTWLFALAYAVCNAAFQIFYICALARGNVSIAVMFANFGMILPIAMSFIIFGEYPSLLRVIGILLIASVFILNLKGGREKKRGYFIFAIASMLTNGAGLCVQKLYAKFGDGGSVFGFVSASYLLGAFTCAAVWLVMMHKEKKSAPPVSPKTILPAAFSGISLALFLALNTYGAKIIDAGFQYPAHSCLAILLSSLSGVLLFKDKLSPKQWIACGIGIVAITLMNL